jgi:D-amino-acid dehydrogenase
MRVLVVGGGIVGVATAYFLNRAGHEVELVERQPQVARETSQANGGQVSWSSAAPWASPDVPRLALHWLLRPHSPLVLRPRPDPELWRWLFRFLGNCTQRRYWRNREIMVRLGRYSRECFLELRRDTGIEYDHCTRGSLQIYRTEKELQAAAAAIPALERLGVSCVLLDRSACLAREPGLEAVAATISGGVYFPGDESGDCRLFTERLAELARGQGVRFAAGTEIRRVLATADRVAGLETANGTLRADAYVLACGSYTPLLLHPLGLRLPVYPLKGYSVTVPVARANAAPSATLTDEKYKIVATRLGDRIRAAGTAELAGYDLTLRPRRCATVLHALRELFPDGGDYREPEFWTGLRPMTPDNLPVIGATPRKNLYLNTGHGTFGWTFACGSARLLSDVLSAGKSAIELRGLTLDRFAGAR